MGRLAAFLKNLLLNPILLKDLRSKPAALLRLAVNGRRIDFSSC